MKRVAVVGCGGIGSVVLCALHDKDLDLYCIEGSEEIAGELASVGINLTGRKGKHVVPGSSFKVTAGFPDNLNFDLIITSVKNNVLHNVFRDAITHLEDGGAILTLENGVEAVKLAEKYPEVNIVAGAVGYNSIMLRRGIYQVTSEGGITIGLLNGKEKGGLLEEIKNIFEPLINISISSNILGVLWAKLLIVCGVTGLGGIAGLRLGELLNLKVSRRLFYLIIDEGCDVADRLGVKIEKFQGGINPALFKTRGGLPKPVKYLILKAIGKKYKNLKSNIHHSLERGERTEVDFLNGVIVEYGKLLNIRTPVNKGVLDITKQIESGKRKMGVENLFYLWDTVHDKN